MRPSAPWDSSSKRVWSTWTGPSVPSPGASLRPLGALSRRSLVVETVSFGWIFGHLLHSNGTNAITLAGALLAVGGVAML